MGGNKPLRDKSARSVTEAFENHILPSFIRLPMKILSDNGVEFRSNRFEDVLNKYGIEHVYSSPYKPASNGAVERINRTLAEFLKSLQNRSNEWDKFLSKAILVYNNTKHSEIGLSPSEKIMTECHEKGKILPISHEEQEKWQEGHPNWLPYGVGVKVKRKIVTVDRTLERKMEERYEGPFTIIKVLSEGMAYEIEGQGKRLRAHYSHLKVWAEPPPYLAEYFDRYRYYQNITEDLRNKDIVEVTQKIVMSEHSREVGSHFLRATKKVKQIESKTKKGSALKEAWKALKGLACEKTREKKMHVHKLRK